MNADEASVTGLTSNPTIFDDAIKESAAYDAAIRCNPGCSQCHLRDDAGALGTRDIGGRPA